MDGKKKKNRKKKGSNHSKGADEATLNGEEPVVHEPENGSATEQNHHPQVPGNSDVQSVGVSESDMELERRKTYQAKFVKLEEEVKQLGDEKILSQQKVGCLEEKIKHLESEVSTCFQREADLEETLRDIQRGNDFLMQEQMMSIKEMIAKYDEVNQGLQIQVKELQESSDNLVQENQQLKESIPALEFRIQHLESDFSLYGSLAVKITEMETASATINKLNAENSKLENIVYDLPNASAPINKLNAENSKLEKIAYDLPNDTVHKLHSAVEPSTNIRDHAAATAGAAAHSDYSTESGKNIQSPARIHEINIDNGIEDFSVSVDAEIQETHLPGFDASRISEDVVSVPLDDFQVLDTDPQLGMVEGDSTIPLSDAPLIGAPFRLISFVTKYVSGADLVSVNRSNPRR